MDLNIAKSRPLFYMCFTLVLSVLFWSNPSVSRAQCIAVGGVKPTHSTKKIILYIENDFASELRQATPAGGVNDAGLTEQQVRSAIMQMAEIWNLQTRAVPLVYGGSVSYDAMSDFCNSVPVQPNHQAVFVNFKNIMKPGSNGKVLMTVRDGMNCTNDYKELVVWGRLSPSNIAPNTVPINWGLGSQSNIGLFSNTMVHELGHIVGLGHANSIGECKSIMAGGTTCNSTNSPLYSTWGGGRYPFRWDKVCSRSYAHRSLKSRLLGFNSNGAIASADISNKNHEQAAIQSGSAHNSINPYASLFKVNLIAAYEPETDSAYLGSDGTFPLSSQITHPSHYDINSLYGVPVVHTFGSIWDDRTRVSFIDEINDTNGTPYNPPYVQFIRTRPKMDATLIQSDKSYRYCSNSSCSTTTAIRSHYPIVSAFDPISGNDIVVQLLTTSLTGNDGGGFIRVHAGLHSGNYIFENGELIPPANLPVSNTAWTYAGRTDVPPSVACAGVSWGSQYNCMLAWLDKDALGGRILYAYFKVNVPGTDVIWDPSGVKIRGGTRTYTSPALGFFGGKFHLSWRSFYNTLYTYSSAAPFLWNWIDSRVQTASLFGAPSFIYEINSEAALVYNTINN